VKTTAGKTKTPETGKRAIRIFAEGDGRLLSVREANSLKQALKDYFETTLRGYDWTDPKHVGNTLTVIDRMGKPRVYVALEVYQEHVLR
jgi:hypothetical protein